jgi:hypothetical protein
MNFRRSASRRASSEAWARWKVFDDLLMTLSNFTQYDE